MGVKCLKMLTASPAAWGHPSANNKHAARVKARPRSIERKSEALRETQRESLSASQREAVGEPQESHPIPARFRGCGKRYG